MNPTELVDVQLSLRTERFAYRTPMKFGGRVVRDVTVASVDATVQNAAGQSGGGIGAMTMGVAWAWPDPAVDGDAKLAVVLDLIAAMIASLTDHPINGHPMMICLRLGHRREALAVEVARRHGLTEPIPPLAILLAGSPIESAIFDAHGKAANRSAYQLLSAEHLPATLGQLIGEAFGDDHPDAGRLADRRIDQFVSPRPVQSLPLYHLVGALDPLSDDDVEKPVGDGLPETLGDWIAADGLTHLKLKLAGNDADWDFRRIESVDRVATQTAPGTDFQYSLDFNESCSDEGYVLELLERLKTDRPEALAGIQYIEQPTARDLTRPDAVTMHRAAEIKPVVIDESLTDLHSLDLAIEQGYSGCALKACKGHAEALLIGAVAIERGLFLCVQDLTCVGVSLLHSASLAAHLTGVAAIESNGRQYCPAGNAGLDRRFDPMFNVTGGRVPTGRLDGPGLGY